MERNFHDLIIDIIKKWKEGRERERKEGRKTTTSIIHNDEMLKIFPLRWRTRQEWPLSTYLFNEGLKASPVKHSMIKTRNKAKLSLIADNFIIYLKRVSVYRNFRVWGAPGWLSQLSVNFNSGHDVAIHEFEPCIWLCADNSEPRACFGFCVSLSLCPSPAHTLSLSLSKINIKKKSIYLYRYRFGKTVQRLLLSHIKSHCSKNCFKKTFL